MSDNYDFTADYGLGSGNGEGISFSPSQPDSFNYSFGETTPVDYRLSTGQESGKGLSLSDFDYSLGDGLRYQGGSQGEGLRVQDFDYSPSQGITYSGGATGTGLSIDGVRAPSSGITETSGNAANQRIAQLLSKLTNLSADNIAKMLLAGWTVNDILKGRKEREKNIVHAGKWAGPRPSQVQAIRTQIQQPAYQPYTGQGAMGRQSFEPTKYVAKGAEGGIMGLAAGGLRDGAFVIPADVVSHFGNGSSEAGLEFLANKLGATPIKGKGDGMSDSIDTTIEGKQPAKVANEEAIVSPEKVAALGKGNPKKGAKVLYAMMARVRKARTGKDTQGKEINPEKFAPGGVAEYASGGAVAFAAGGATPTYAPINTNIAEWAIDPIQDYLTQGFALANAPYQAYKGPLSAGTSPLQQQAFGQYAGLQASPYFSQAGSLYGQAARGLGNLSYKGAQFGNQYQAPAAYQTGKFANQYQGPAAYQTGQFNAGFQYAPTNFANQYAAPTAYQTTKFDTGLGGVKSVEEYINPYMQNVTDIAAREARRQSDISRLSDAARLSSAGAFGGSRQAMMEAEGRRNLGTQIGDIQAKGLEAAYSSALQQRLAESDRSIAAQRAAEESKQYGYGQGMTAAQLRAQYGLSAQEATEQARQFGAKTAADYRLEAQRAAEASRQYGYGKGMESAEQRAQYGLAALRDTESSRQYGYGKGMESAEQRARYGLDALRDTETSRQFAAKYGADALRAQMEAAQGLGSLASSSEATNLARLRGMLDAGGTQRGVEAEKIDALRRQFDEERAYDLKMQQYKQSLLSDLPIEQGPAAAAPTLSTELLQGLTGLAKTSPELKKYFESIYGDIFKDK